MILFDKYCQGICNIVFLYIKLPEMLDKEELMFSMYYHDIVKKSHCFYKIHFFR